MTLIAGIGLTALLLLLLWQLRRSHLPWRWRLLWLPTLLALALALQPVQIAQMQRELVVVTPGDARSDAAANAAAAARQQTPQFVATAPDLQSWQQLQAALAAHQGQRLLLFGHGWTEPVWQSLPSQTVVWTPAEVPDWQLEYVTLLQQGDALILTLRAPAPVHHVQLLDSRGVPVTETVLQDGVAELRYRPASAGRFDWQLRARSSSGDLVRDIAVAFAVQQAPQLTIQGEFGAPSFEQRALREWWQQTGMQGEFVTRTGQQLQRRDRFNLAMDATLTPDIFVRDLRSWLAASRREQQQLLQQVGEGRSLLLLSDGSEQDEAMRRRLSDSLALQWQALADAEQTLLIADTELLRSAWLPQADHNWQTLHDRAILQRNWQHGRILWLGIGNSHRLWQRARPLYAEWWQRSLPLPGAQQPRWQTPAEGLVHQPAALCLNDAVAADGVAVSSLQLQNPSGQSQTVALVATAVPGRICGWFRPAETGWYRITAPVNAEWRVRAAPSLPEQQWHQAQAATRMHTQTQPSLLPERQQSLPPWPFVTVAVLLLAVLWWRERIATVRR